MDISIASTSQANLNALARLGKVRPAWTAVRTAREAVGLPEATLLHAGPPLDNPRQPPKPLLASAILCCLHEGWARDEAQAQRLIEEGRIALYPAQHYGAVTPLAAVISPSTSLVEVTDLNGGEPARRAWSLLGSGAGPQIRFGSRNPEILPRLLWRDRVLAPALSAALQRGAIELNQLAAAGLAGGDDMHGRTSAANAALCERLIPALPDDATPEVASMLASSPLFFLTLWMAACHLILDAAGDRGRDPASTLVVGFAGNGEHFGIRLAGNPSQWVTEPGRAPAGPRFNPGLQADPLPVIGDSGAIDAVGFGGQALSFSPEISAALQEYLPSSWQDRPALLIDTHPAFAEWGLRTGLDAGRVAASGLAPLAAIAMIDANGEHGLLGRGVFMPSSELFANAVAALRPAEQDA